MKLKKNYFFLKLSRFIFYRIINLVEFLIAIPLLALIYVIGPIKKIRFYKITANRLGHFAINTELYLCQNTL